MNAVGDSKSDPLPVPSYLAGHEAAYRRDPRAAAVEWFRAARSGLFMHYGLYSILGRHEWVQYREKIPVAEYARLKDRFTAERFDADAICDLALAAGMKYVNLTTRHHDGFCLFRTAQTDFSSVNSPARRDLVAELAAACEKRRLGLCLYYSHGRDWRHPHAPNNDEWGGHARPEYDPPEPSYATGAEHDLNRYLDFMAAQITELLTQYGPVAAIWLDGHGVPVSPKAPVAARHRPREGADIFRVQELYDLIHRLQPQVLLSYKWGYLGTEDFLAPEHKTGDTGGKCGEVCRTTHAGWGYVADDDGHHATADDIWEMLRQAGAAGFNLLLNTGPLGDGSIHPEDDAAFREVGRRLRAEGFPR